MSMIDDASDGTNNTFEGSREPPQNSDSDHDGRNDQADSGSGVAEEAVKGPGADLDPDEGSDAFETPQESREAKPTRENRRDEDVISLDTPD